MSQPNTKIDEVNCLAGNIAAKVYTPLDELTVTAWVTREPAPFAERCSGTKLSLTAGNKWGDLFDCAWFHFTGVVPMEASGQCVVLLVDINGEACVVDAQGDPLLGLTNISSHFDFSLGMPGKRVVPVCDCARGGEVIDLWADAGCNDLFGMLQENGTLKEAVIAVCHPHLYALHYDVEVLAGLLEVLPEDTARHGDILAALLAASGVLEEFTNEEASRARAILAPLLAEQDDAPSFSISAVGHSHIDLAWLWPLRETIRKGARTFSTVLHNMERYPDYVFGASQPQLYQWMKEHYPALYARVKQRIAEGRWELQGAMWVEADTNVPAGESLVRQLLYGQRFFRAEFGRGVTNLWLPDVFGYSGALPQLIRKAGCAYFMTQKLSWNRVNRHPHHTFHWQGIDGTSVLAHMLPEGTYNSAASPQAVGKSERNYLDKNVSDRAMICFGIGDGGGGPGEEHLERLSREKNLAGLPTVTQEPAERFFAALDNDREKYATWVGDLYLECHQGTYTTQARSKRYNRKMEIALREAEFAAARALAAGVAPYPAEELEQIWKEVLLYQFHDILPGSSIDRVYEESLARYALLLQQTEAITADAVAAYYAHIDVDDMREPVVVANTLSWPRHDYVRVGSRWFGITVSACGYATLDAAAAPAPFQAPTAAEDRLENEYLLVRLHRDGSLEQVLDKRHQREVLTAAGNRLAVYDDPGDAWDFPMDYDTLPPQYFRLQSATASVDGPRAVLRQVYTYGDSTLTQQLTLTAGSPRLDFITHVDWRERGEMLRTSFPVAVQANEATCEIQYGHLTRPTHRNTSWDVAKYEVCAQRWVDLSTVDYGVALLNDCKYGHKLLGNVLDMNLLRSPANPGKHADLAEHDFTYSLYPHAGDCVRGEVMRAAAELNVPLRVDVIDAHPGTQASSASLVQIDTPNIVLDALKKAEDSDDLILRCYDASGAGARATITLGPRISAACTVNLLEEEAQALSVTDNAVVVDFHPFEIITLKITLAGEK